MQIFKANTKKYEPYILPCPFCGEPEEIYLEEYEHGAGKRWRIVCVSCMAQIDRGYDQGPGELCKLWNTRAEENLTMKLSQFYELLNGHASLTLQQNNEVIYKGPLNSLPNKFDTLTVLNFKGTASGFVFTVA